MFLYIALIGLLGMAFNLPVGGNAARPAGIALGLSPEGMQALDRRLRVYGEGDPEREAAIQGFQEAALQQAGHGDIAGRLLVPAEEGIHYNQAIDHPEIPGDINNADPYRLLGHFDIDGQETSRGMIRGMMDFKPGGITAIEGFNRQKTMDEYPRQMEGIPQGNMPVYR